ncbi:MAG: hypothetical protein KAI27_03200 [Rhodospirillaceae bacterium]|nr:hypothetical protein [Rhodospirillaceae bacterium]
MNEGHPARTHKTFNAEQNPSNVTGAMQRLRGKMTVEWGETETSCLLKLAGNGFYLLTWCLHGTFQAKTQTNKKPLTH